MGKRGRRAVKGGKKLRTESVFGGCPKAMSELQLPLWKDVGLHLEDLEEGGTARPQAVKKTAKKVEEIYEVATINCLPIGSIQRKIKILLSLKRNHEIASKVDTRTGKVKDLGKWRRKRGNHKAKMKLSEVADSIFEVKKGEVSDLEKEFYLDQCGPRKMVIGKLDVKETNHRISLMTKQLAVQQNRDKREAAMKKSKEKQGEMEKLLFRQVSWNEKASGEVPGDEAGAEEELVDDGEVRLGTRGQTWCTTGSKRKRMTAEESQFLGEVLRDRFDVSSTAASTLFNLHASSSKSDLKVNQSQVAKMKRKLRLKKTESFKPANQPEAIGFDERKDNSKCVVGVGEGGHKRYETQKVFCLLIIVIPCQYWMLFRKSTVPSSSTLETSLQVMSPLKKELEENWRKRLKSSLKGGELT